MSLRPVGRVWTRTLMADETTSSPKKEMNAGSLFADASWRSFGYGVSLIAKFALMPVLARLLTEEEIGVAAIGFSFIIFFYMVGFAGLPQALIIAKNDRPELWSSAFWFNLGVGTLLGAASFLCAPHIAGAVKTPEATPIIRAFSVLIPFQVIQAVGWARLMRDQRHSRLALADMSSDILGAVLAVAAAFAGWGVWSLVVQQFVATTARLAVNMWRVGLHLKLHFDWADLKPMAKFAGNIAITDMFVYAVQGIPMIVLGRVFSSAIVGQFEMGRRLAYLPKLIFSASIYSALFPAFARLRDEPYRLRAAVLRSIHLSNCILAPVYLGLAAVALPATQFLFGMKWEASAPILGLLAVGLAIGSITNGATAYFSGIGLAGRNLLIAVVMAASTTIGAVVGSRTGNVEGVAAGILICDAIAVPGLYIMWMRHMGVGFGDGAISALKPLVAAFIMAGVVWLALDRISWFEDISILRLMLGASLGGLVYLGVMLVIDRGTTMQVMQLVGGRLPFLPAPVKRLIGLQS